MIATDDGLTFDQRLGWISINVLVSVLTTYLIGQMVASGLIGGLPILLMALIIGFALPIAASVISLI
ncbi:hypothetical protein [Variovorax terrae]|uniref:Uncharacterized protein n=1 Tax=Variovorax terrae TaxID=2923278 RepID=A0A9X2AN87_9BURK|nr:hypothetical protein [Variovorax terrae]MCJ0763535.1 hypothetical protein [Variovorax terrae]